MCVVKPGPFQNRPDQKHFVGVTWERYNLTCCVITFVSVNTLNSPGLEGSERYIGRTDPHHVLLIQLLEVMRMHKAFSCFVLKPTIEPSPNLGEVGMIIHVLHKHILLFVIT